MCNVEAGGKIWILRFRRQDGIGFVVGVISFLPTSPSKVSHLGSRTVTDFAETHRARTESLESLTSFRQILAFLANPLPSILHVPRFRMRLPHTKPQSQFSVQLGVGQE